MKRFLTWSRIAWIEVRQWRADYRAWMIFALEAVLVMRSMIGLSVYGLTHNTHTTPWVLTLLFSDATIAKNFIKVLLYAGIIVLFCNAPFVSHLTPSVLLRGKRKGWIGGEIAYVFLVSFLYLAFLIILSMLCILPTVSLSELWGSSLYRIAGGSGIEHIVYIRMLLLPSDLMNKVYPEYAMGYTVITAWLSFSLLGLLIMAANIGSGRKETGVVAAVALVAADPVVAWIASWGPVQERLYFFSPVSWTSMEHLHLVSGTSDLSFLYVLIMYLFLIALLILFIRNRIKRQEIEIL